MLKKYWREFVLGMLTFAAIAIVFCLAPIPQDPQYHEFADRQMFFGVANFGNVFSNLPFLLVGTIGLIGISRLAPSAPRAAYVVFCVGSMLVGLGSAYYHYAPAMLPLVWDRLPMTVAFMALFSMVVHDRLSEKLGRAILWPMIAAGFASVMYWYGSELQGQGDLRPYGLVQFLPMVLIPLMLLLYPGKSLHSAWLWATIGTYALGKVAEHFDQAIYEGVGVTSGHSIKHLLGALAVFWATLAATRPQAPVMTTDFRSPRL